MTWFMKIQPIDTFSHALWMAMSVGWSTTLVENEMSVTIKWIAVRL